MFLFKNDPGGNRRWFQQFGSARYDTAQAVAVDNGGNVYVAGYTQYNPNNPSRLSNCIMLVKYDSTGAVQWSRILDADADTGAEAVAADNAGNVYVAGYTRGSVDGTPNAGERDLFVIRFDGGGNVLWSRQMGTSADDYAAGVAVDRTGNACVAGSTSGNLDGNSNAGGYDLFILKLDGSGSRLWSRLMGTAASDHAESIATDNVGNIVVAGYTYGVMDGIANAGGNDLFVVKCDSGGNTVWSRQMGTPLWDSAEAVAIDGNGNIYAAGATLGGLDGNANAGVWDLFLASFDSMGNGRWTRQWGGISDDFAEGVALDGTGNVYVAGGSSDPAGIMDSLLLRYDTAGNLR